MYIMLRRNECRLNFKNRPVRTGDLKGGGPKQPPLLLIGVARSLPLIGLITKDLKFLRPDITFNTRTGGGSENHTVWRGGAYNAPPSISAPMRANATNFGGYLGLYYNFFWPKFWDHGSTPSWSKRVEFSKCWPFWQKRTVFRFFRASSVTIIAMKNLKKTFESYWNALSLRCHQISA